MIRQGCQVFACSPSDDEAMHLAFDYIKANNLTADDVKMMKGEKVLYIETKREINLIR